MFNMRVRGVLDSALDISSSGVRIVMVVTYGVSTFRNRCDATPCVVPWT